LPIAEGVPASDGRAKSTASAEGDPAPDAGKSNVDDPDRKATPMEVSSTVDAAPGIAVDSDRVSEQFARLFELAEAGEEDDGLQKDLKDFEADEVVGDRERELDRSLRMHVETWIASLPPDLAPYVLLVSAECRIAACRLLIAQNNVAFSGPKPSLDALMAATTALLDPNWLESIGLRYRGLTMHPNGGGPPDTALYILKFTPAGR
jgi:hypothetical protein